MLSLLARPYRAVNVAVGLLACFLFQGPTAFGQVATNPIVLWTFDEGTGTTVLDSSGNNHAATIVGATYVVGHSNTALLFNGSNNFAFTSDAASGGTTVAGLDIGVRDWTLAAWINSTSSGMVLTKMA